ncbi:MAG TPA: 3-oxoacyl-[acyl-carrier-protein] synthase III C-terminal domain-containing protein [Patescibacteria group bacterium]|nr:3-oxoacyl-[acyl-carrier-protein] synthase III C-terminal domain-containing protein [Patescibacteria group bacterium]
MTDYLSGSAHPILRSVGCALPQNYYPQETLASALWNEWSGKIEDRFRFERLHRSVGVRGRHLALPMDEYREINSFGKSNDKWIQRAAELGEEAVSSALASAGLSPEDVDHIFFTTVTGVASPSIDARLVNRLAMRPDIKRTPIFGLGCVGGAAGIARAADYVRAFTKHIALLVSVELCSLTLQLKDLSVANIISSGLFADGAAAVVIAGADVPVAPRLPRIIASRSMFFHHTEEMMGWHVGDSGFEIVLSPGVPDLVRNKLRDGADSFLDEHGLTRRDIRHWIAHTGGPKVLLAMEEALEIPRCSLERSWQSLASIGNLSSASVLFVAADFLKANVAREGDYGVLLSMGPGFCGELILLRWCS